MALAAIAGGLAGLGAGYIQGEQQDAAYKQSKAMNRSLEAVMRSAFANDPLWNMILGASAQNRGAPWNPEEMYERGLEQLGYVQKRRAFDMERELAARGFGGPAGQPQQQFASTALDQQMGNERASLRDLVDQTTVQARQQELLGGWDAFSQLLGQRMGLGASLGVLGELAPKGGTGTGMYGMNADNAPIPDELRGNFWMQG